MGSALKTEHPHIVKVADVLGGEPAITGTRVGVAFIARLLQAGEEPSAIVAAYPHLAPAAVYDAISYYLDHREKVDAFITDSTLEALGQRYGFEIAVDGSVGRQALSALASEPRTPEPPNPPPQPPIPNPQPGL